MAEAVELIPGVAYNKSDLRNCRRLALMNYAEETFGIPRSKGALAEGQEYEGPYTADFRTQATLVKFIWEVLYGEKMGWLTANNHRLSSEAPKEGTEEGETAAEEAREETEVTEEAPVVEISAVAVATTPAEADTEEGHVAEKTPAVTHAAENGLGTALKAAEKALRQQVAELSETTEGYFADLHVRLDSFEEHAAANIGELTHAVQRILANQQNLATLILYTISGIEGAEIVSTSEMEEAAARIVELTVSGEELAPSEEEEEEEGAEEEEEEGAEEEEEEEEEEEADAPVAKAGKAKAAQSYKIKLASGQTILVSAADLMDEEAYSSERLEEVASSIGINVKGLGRVLAVTTIQDRLAELSR